MIERNLEIEVLREMRTEKKFSELHREQRSDLQRFCNTWEDILLNLSSLSDSSNAKGKIVQMALKKKYGHLSISAYLRSELFYWIAYRNHEGSSF